MVELVEKFLEGIKDAEELLVASSSVVIAESYGDEVLSYSPDYSV